MRILRIAGKNLASLAGEFCVDFEQEPLASSGLFAISGPTGAGKSTLLDALCLALYDATPRLLKMTRGASMMPDVGTETVSAQDPRSLLRRGAAEAWAEVDFVGNDGLRYRARWLVRRSYSRVSGVLQASRMSLHQLPDLLALGGTKTEVMTEIALRIGLSFEQFTRAVLLAQNEFSAFLKTDENDRGELLETLTGSAIYSVLSRRAYERYKTEQGATAQLSARLADQAPLDAETRAVIALELRQAEARLALIDEHKAGLEHQLRWHQASDKLRQGEAEAQAALASALEQREAAAERRAHLARLDAVQPARPLAAEIERLGAEQEQLRLALDEGQQQLGRAVAGQQQATLAAVKAIAHLEATEQAQKEASPQLDRAKALDATIAALSGTHAQAKRVRDDSVREAAAARLVFTASAEALASSQRAHEADALWLAEHHESERLAQQWPRWESLLTQAEQAAAQALALEQAAGKVQQNLARANATASEAAEASAAALAAQQAAEGRRQAAIAALAAIDSEQLRAARVALDLRREQIASARAAWDALIALGQRHQVAQEESTQVAAAKESAAAGLARAIEESGALASALEQAERSLNVAEIACADSVEDLRATLADGSPCPVCGSEAHPYQHQNATLHAMLDSLRVEVKRCRAQLNNNLSQQASHKALLDRSGEQLVVLERDLASLTEALEKQQSLWLAQPLAHGAPAEESRAAWLAQQAQDLKQRGAELDLEEAAARQTAVRRDAAQADYDLAARMHMQRLDDAVGARAALASAMAEQTALADKRGALAQLIAGLMAELDPAFAAGWQTQWQADASAFLGARAREAGEWQRRHSQHAAREATLGTLGAEQRAAQERLMQADKLASVTVAEFTRIDAEIRGRQQERGALWDGRAVTDIEREFGLAIEQARALLAAAQGASVEAAQVETRAREALLHGAQRREAVTVASSAAVTALAHWLATFSERQSDITAPADQVELGALLAVDHGWIGAERRAIAALDGHAASAATVLAERRAQLAQHHQAMPHPHTENATELAETLDALLQERAGAQQLSTSLGLQLAQDDARRAKAAAILGEIERQQMIEQRWGKLNELIGSADGKKFRNYAQQFTLDVLLGYANSHLQQLARRYRLDRVQHASGPSLGLMVRDQDMGGEVRSVNSLSGGESFLVSLALALGLASLSSNRVKVESLFIDEGFGSLDSDTLRVAMDALDGLQSMGRKVGVISHVQEMTERIATKILVLPTGGGSSSVSVQ